MTRRRRWTGIVALVATLLVAAGCTSGSLPIRRAPTGSTSPTPLAGTSAARALDRLCDRPPTPTPEPAETTAAPPPAIEEVIDGVEAVRGLEFRHPVAAAAVGHEELVRRLSNAQEQSIPTGLLARRSRVWDTIGVVPDGTSLKEVLERYASQQVIGFYDPASGELVFIGTADPSPFERLTLAHELTHALDDQYFHLERLNTLEHECRDEELLAATGVVEGSAQYFSFAFARRFFTQEERETIASAGGGATSGIPPFILALQLWPYISGYQFVSAVAARGGTEAVNAAIQDPPATTEQVLHPERYGVDAPVSVDVPDVGPELAGAWEDLDVMVVGEEWLQAMLRLRLDSLEADPAAAGWDGGLYRAWASGDRVAVVLETEWDSADDAAEFAEAVGNWLGDEPGSVHREGARVTVLFATDDETLEALEGALSVD